MNLFQSPEWEQFKLATGWQKSHRVDDILILQKSLPLGRTMLYSPMVDEPELVRIMNKESRIKDSVVSEILKIGKSNKAIFYRLELDVPAHNSSFPEGTLELGITHNSLFKKSFEEMQPEHTIVLDIDKSDDEILGQMKPKGRYNIKVAGKYNLEGLVSLINQSDLMIANSTGPIHIAAALGKYVIGFYPKIVSCSPKRWGPYTNRKIIFSPAIDCTNCTREQCRKLNCMDSIDVKEVVSAAKKLLLKQ